MNWLTGVKMCTKFTFADYSNSANTLPLTLFHTAWGSHHPLFTLNVSNFNWDGERWLKTFWQLSFKPSWCIDKVYFENLFFKNVKNLNFKTAGSDFCLFWSIFMNWWLWGKFSWLWIRSAGLKSWQVLTF